MAWGAAATGTPGATGSTGQGLSLMQESLAELALRPAAAGGAQHGARAGRLLAGHARRRPRRLPRMPVLAPMDVPEAVELDAAGVPPRRTMAQPGPAVRRLLPRAHVHARSTSGAARLRARPGRRLGARRVHRRHRPGPAAVAARHHQAQRRRRLRPRRALPRAARARTEEMLAGVEPLVETGFTDDADVVVVAFGTPGEVRARRGAPASAAEGARVGFVRPITLLPVPERRDRAAAAAGRRVVARLREQPGPDGRRRPPGRRSARRPVEFIGGLSLDGSGFGIAPDLDGGYLARPDPEELTGDERSDRSSRPTRRRRAGARLVDDFTPTLHRRRRAPPLPRLR